MATSSKSISIFFLVSLFSLAVHARDSQFFSKVTHDNTIGKDTELNNNNNNVVKDTQLPTKEESLNKQEPEPTFVPDTQNSYELYGHETGQLPPSQTSNYAPYVTKATGYKEPYEFQQLYMDDAKYGDNSYVPNQENNYYDGKDRFAGNSYTTKSYANNYYNDELNKNGYQKDIQRENLHYNNQGMMDTRLTSVNENGDSTMSYRNENLYSNNNGERQGMSDTRFMENGRYFYDIKNERYVPIPNQYENNNVNNYRNYNYGNNNMNYYDNNKSMESYPNQEEEFESQDEFQP